MGPGGNEERSQEISRDLKQFGWFENGPLRGTRRDHKRSQEVSNSLDGLIWAPGGTRSSRDLKQFGWFEMGPGGNEERSHEISQFGWFEMGPGVERISRDLEQFGWFEMVPERHPGDITRDLMRSLSRKISHTDKSAPVPNTNSAPLTSSRGLAGPRTGLEGGQAPPAPTPPARSNGPFDPPHPSPHPPPTPPPLAARAPPAASIENTSFPLAKAPGE